MQDYRQRLDNALVQLQYILDEQFEDNEDIQNAFNALACALDYYVDEE
jgi:hypothetical protein